MVARREEPPGVRARCPRSVRRRFQSCPAHSRYQPTATARLTPLGGRHRHAAVRKARARIAWRSPADASPLALTLWRLQPERLHNAGPPVADPVGYVDDHAGLHGSQTSTDSLVATQAWLSRLVSPGLTPGERTGRWQSVARSQQPVMPMFFETALITLDACQNVQMSDNERFEDWLRAIADEVSRSVQRMSEFDVDELSQRYGVDADRARAFADAAGRWLNGRFAAGDPLFGRIEHADDDSAVRPRRGDLDLEGRPEAGPTPPRAGAGPHPLDRPTDQQGLSLSALDSGRWTVRPGSNQLAGSGAGAEPAPSEVVGELRARDWITADGTLTLVGRHALGRWCTTPEDPGPPPPSDVPPA